VRILDLEGRKWQEAEEVCIMRSFINPTLNHILPNIIRLIKSRRMRWAGHVACMGEVRNLYSMSVGKSEGRNHSEDLGVDGRIKLECISKKKGGKLWTAFIWLMIETSGGIL
jgi:hypothetical protein